MAFLTCPVKTYVIVPGAWQGPYAWQTVKSQLEGQGQKVIVVELPVTALLVTIGK